MLTLKGLQLSWAMTQNAPPERAVLGRLACNIRIHEPLGIGMLATFAAVESYKDVFPLQFEPLQTYVCNMLDRLTRPSISTVKLCSGSSVPMSLTSNLSSLGGPHVCLSPWRTSRYFSSLKPPAIDSLNVNFNSWRTHLLCSIYFL